MNDENEQTYPFTIDSLLDKALGPEGYYGAFTANMHTDYNDPNEPRDSMDKSNAIIASAQARGVPVVSARQMLTWLDGRNRSSFGSITWNNATGTLGFTVTAAAGSRGIQAMLPFRRGSAVLSGVSPQRQSGRAFSVEPIKGIEYAIFAAAAGTYARRVCRGCDRPGHLAADRDAPRARQLPSSPGILTRSPTPG